MIKRIRVKNLNGEKSFDVKFHSDINIITGRNGAGKTTLLKLIWYIFSGNIERAVYEIKFESVLIETDEHLIKVFYNKKYSESDRNYLRGNNKRALSRRRNIIEDFDVEVIKISNNELIINSEYDDIFLPDIELAISTINKKSMFFPTFRRIEGGFTTSRRPLIDESDIPYEGDRLDNAVKWVSKNLTNKDHLFITSISTFDIVDLITKEYAHMSEEANRKYIELSRSIESKINSHTFGSNNINNEQLLNQANITLKNIKNEMQKNLNYREELFKPLTVLNKMIKEIFQYKGIKVTENVTLGELEETTEAMFSDYLSAGEKQMLSFICYNAFYKEIPIFIDEPEISLHVDWQRTLLPTLQSQNSKNQFIVATHSPFIYTKYVDKEIILNEDRGGW